MKGLAHKMNLPLWALFLAAQWLLTSVCSADTSLTLKNEFIEKYKDKATIATDFTMLFAHEKPKTPSPSKPANDGDIHISGTSADIQLPVVAEIMNAALQSKAVKFVNQAKGTGTPVHVVGAWRIWTEHGGDDSQVQGGGFPEIRDTNPAHVFEIHPLTQVANFSVASSFRPIKGYRTKNAMDAFHVYENVRSKIILGTGTTTITTGMAGYNYVEFRLKLLEDPTLDIGDGLMVFGSVLDLGGEQIVRKRRIVFVAGTTPEKGVRLLHAGQCMHVLGIPRLDLALVSWRVERAATEPDALNWGLPYEIVVVADYKDNSCGSN